MNHIRHKTYFYIVSLVFLLVALAHLARVLLGWNLVVDLVDVPTWVSWVAVLVIGYLAILGLKLGSKSQD